MDRHDPHEQGQGQENSHASGLLPGSYASDALPPPETQPALGPLGQHVLARMLHGYLDMFLAEYYRALADQGRRIPHHLLAAVLDHALVHPEVGDELPDILGNRGHWLAHHLPRWRPLVAFRDPATWPQATSQQRWSLFKILLRRQPAQARALLRLALPLETPGGQRRFINQLYPYLEPADESLLAPCMHLPDPELRRNAAQLLVRIPGSVLVEQLWAVAQTMLSLTVDAAGERELTVSLPARWQPGWQALGIAREAPHWGSEGAGWLGQMLRLLPPDRWSTHWQVAPRTLLQLAMTLPIAQDVIEGWRSATYWHQQPDWAQAFLLAHLTGTPATGESILTNRCLPGEQAADLILPYIPAGARLSDTPAPWQQALLSIRAPWPRVVQRRVLDLLEDTLLDPPEGRWEEGAECIRSLLWYLEREIDEADQVEVAHCVHQLLRRKTAHQERMSWALKMIRFKIQLQQSLQEPPGPDE